MFRAFTIDSAIHPDEAASRRISLAVCPLRHGWRSRAGWRIIASKGARLMLDRRTMLLGLGATIATPALAQGISPAARLIAAARKQIGVTLLYDPAYTRLTFPGGDVPREKGVCTDVVIRAYRDALATDLQALVNADMRRAFSAYPHHWGLSRPDRSIDHRRVPNLATFLKRQRAQLRVPADLADWRPGDIFTSLVGANGSLPHIGIVSDKRGAKSWQVIHNIGRGTREEDALGDWPINGRFRWALG
jgi:uncharacterized protein YijF (DUF1287 family)